MAMNQCTRIVTLVALVCIVACTPGKHELAFCGVSEGLSSRPDFILDLKAGRVLGSDTSSTIEILETNVAKGFVSPFPLSLPKQPLAADLTSADWELGGVMFSAIRGHGFDRAWTLIQARAPDSKQFQGVVRKSSVLYSEKGGVLAIQLLSEHDGQAIASEFFSCGTATLHAEQL